VSTLIRVERQTRRWQRPLASVAFLVALTLLTARTCQTQSASAEVQIRVGEAGADLRELDLELRRPGEQEVLGFFRRSFERGADPVAARWPVRADAGMYRLAIRLRSARGSVRVERALHIEDGATVTIDVERDLTAR
jgi:hypothetical protein